MEIIGYIIYESVYMICNLMLLFSILKAKLTERKKNYVVALVLIIIGFAVVGVIGTWNGIPVFVVIEGIIAVLLIDEKRIWKRIMWHFVSINAIYILETPFVTLIAYIMKLSNWEIADNYLLRALPYLICFFILVLFKVILDRLRDNKKLKLTIAQISTRNCVIFIIGVFGFNLINSGIMARDSEQLGSHQVEKMQQYEKAILIGVSVIAVAFLILILFILYIDSVRKVDRMKVQMSEQYLEFQKVQYEDIMHTQKSIQKLNHDMKHHMGCISILLRNEKYDEVQKYVSNLNEVLIETVRKKINTGNNVSDAVLRYYELLAQEKEIDFAVDGGIPAEIFVSKLDLSSILSNAVSNAFEAAEKVTGKKRGVAVDLAQYKDYLFIRVGNSTAGRVDAKYLEGRSTKGDDKQPHGLGTKILKEIVMKYDGNIEYKIDENYILMEITLRLS